MKKALGIVLLLSAIAAAVVFVILKDKDVKGPAQLLPQTTAVYIESENIFDNIEFIRSTKFGQFVENLDIAGLMKEMGQDEKKIKDVERSIQDIKTYYPAAKGAFTGKAVIAFDQKLFDTSKSSEELLQGLTLFIEPEFSSKFLASIESMATKGRNIATELYKKRSIKTVKQNDELSLSYVTTNGNVIMAFSVQPLKECIDRADAKQPKTLASQKEYTQMRARFKAGYQTISYCNIHLLIDKLQNSLMSQAHLSQQQKEQFTAAYEALTSLGEATYRKGKTIKSVAHIDFNYDKLTDLSKRSFTLMSPEGPKAISSIIPAEPALFYASSGMDFKALFEQTNQATEIDYNQANPMITQFLGLSIQEILEALGSTAGYVVGKPQQGLMFPTAELTVFIELQNAAAIETALTSALSKGLPIPTKEITHKDIKLTSIPIEGMIGVNPTFTVYNNYLIVSTYPQFIQQMIDVKDTPDSLLKSVKIQDMFRDTPKTSQIFSFNGAEAHNVIKPFVMYYFDKSAARTPNEQVAREKVILPLLETLSSIKSSTVSSTYHDKGCTINTTTEWQ